MSHIDISQPIYEIDWQLHLFKSPCRFLFGLSIRHVGQETSKDIAGHFGTFQHFWKYLLEEVEKEGERENVKLEDMKKKEEESAHATGQNWIEVKNRSPLYPQKRSPPFISYTKHNRTQLGRTHTCWPALILRHTKLGLNTSKYDKLCHAIPWKLPRFHEMICFSTSSAIYSIMLHNIMLVSYYVALNLATRYRSVKHR